METIKISKISWIILSIILGFSNAIFAQAPSQKYCVELAETFYQNMTKGNYTAMHDTFNENLKQEIPLEELKKHVQNLYKTYGKIIKRDSTILGVMAEHTVSIIPLYFEKKNLELRLAINSKKKVDGLFFTIFDPKSSKNKSK